jgi:hypothetical protein
MSIKKARNPNWGGARLESKLIQKYADQWCRDNGYPIQRRQYLIKKKVDIYLKRNKI